MTFWEALTTLRDKLAAVPGVKTCRIGLEPNITPDDYPIARLVPSRIEQRDGRVRYDVLIYFGLPIHSAETGIEAEYQQLFDMERAIVAAVKQPGFVCQWIETITDEDRLEHYKLMAVRVEIILPSN